jgi:CD109 antigen
LFSINETNSLQLQYQELERKTETIDIRVAGNGFAHVQVSYQYNTNVLYPQRRYDLKVRALTTNNQNLLHLQICASYIPEGNSGNSASMTLMEINLPSGYYYDPETSVKKAGVMVNLRYFT